MKATPFIHLITAAFLLNSGIMLNAQNTQNPLERNVTVERDFQPVIKDAGKITTLPEILDVRPTKERVVYSEIYQPLPFDKSVVPLKPTEVNNDGSLNPRASYLRLGMGNFWNTQGDLALPILRKEKTRLDLTMNHLGTFGEKQHAISKGMLDFNYFMKKVDLYAGAGMSHQYFNYYGDQYDKTGKPVFMDHVATVFQAFNPIYDVKNVERIDGMFPTIRLNELRDLHLSDMLWRYNAHAGFRVSPNAKGQQYNGEMSYEQFSSDHGLKEHIVAAQFGYVTPFMKHRLGFDVEFSNLFYNQHQLPTVNFYNFYAVLSLNPYVQMERKQLKVRAGFNTTMSFVHGRPFSMMPDVSFEWKVLPRVAAFYGGVKGEFASSTLSRIYAENPYVSPDLRVKDYYAPINPYLGLKIRPLHNMLIDAFLDYKFIDDQYFFVNQQYVSTMIGGDSATLYSNRFNVIYADAQQFRMGGRISYNFKNTVNLQAKAIFNQWSVTGEEYAWMKPAFEADFMTDVNVNRHLNVSAKIFYEGYRHAKLGDTAFRMDPKLDVNLAASYAFNQTFSAFAKLNNVLNSKYQQFYGYDVQGINFLLGGAVAF